MSVSSFILLGWVALVPPSDPLPFPMPGVPEGPIEIAPPPRVVVPPVAIAAIPGGYQIRLNRVATDRLQGILDRTDEKEVANGLRQLAKGQKEGANPDEEAAAKLELIAFLVSSQLPGFKKSLRDNSGPGGAVITVTGLQAPAVKFRKPRPRLERAVEVVRGTMPLMPPEGRDAIEALRAIARTTPLLWKVEPLE